MTPEKRETAINWLKEEIRSLRRAPEINGCGPENWADLLEIMETCLEAVKNHFHDLTKMVPLSPEQLREMDGEPKPNITLEDAYQIGSWNKADGWIIDEYLDWEIDREAWTAKWEVDEFGHKCSKCGEYLPSGDDDIFPQFCPNCGRATTADALEELEKRLRG